MSGAGGADGGGENNVVWFLYTGQPNSDIPRDVSHVRIDQSVKVIAAEAFRDCEQLVEVEFCVGLNKIGIYAFDGCKSLKDIKFPSTVKVIDDHAFHGCEQLVGVELCEGLEQIGENAFYSCKSLQQINLPSAVKKIGRAAFCHCEQLMSIEIEFCEEVEAIHELTFCSCRCLRHIKLPPNVKVIGQKAFRYCSQLEEVKLCEGLERIEVSAFKGCKSLKGIKIPFTVKLIAADTFRDCERLIEAELCEGVTRIGVKAFSGCKYMKCIKVPSTVKMIGNVAFSECVRLTEVEFCEGLIQIGAKAYRGCKSLRRIKIPSSVEEIGEGAFYWCGQLSGVELCDDGITKMNKIAFQNCFSLRNVAVLKRSPALKCFGGCHDLLRVLGSQKVINRALKSRFDRLPIHRLCYYHSHHPTEVTINLLKRNIIAQRIDASLMSISDTDDSNQDCLGMTPLHILTCSSKHNIDLYQTIIARYPICLITKDKWGCVPLLYAIWGGAHEKIVKYLINGQKSAFPNHILDWDGMVETFCRAGVSLDIVKKLFGIHRTSFSKQCINWKKAAREMAIRFLVEQYFFGYGREIFFEDWGIMMEALGASNAHQDLIQNLLEIQQNFWDDQEELDLQLVCEELVQPLTGWWRPDNEQKQYSMKTFQFLVKCNIAERLNAIGAIRKWRSDVKNVVGKIKSVNHLKLDTHFDSIHSTLITYERKYHQLKDAAFLLELALWKSKIDESLEDDNGDTREGCRVNCGAVIIIPNVLQYLISR